MSRQRRRLPWTAWLVPPSYRDSVVGDAFEEVARHAARPRWRTWAWLHWYLVVAALAAWRQTMMTGRRTVSHSPGTRVMFAVLKTDLRYALRSLTRAPGFVIVSVVTLALGVGGVTAMYSLLYGSLLRPLAYERAHELVVLHTKQGDAVFPGLSKPDLDDVRAAATGLGDLAAWRAWNVTVTPVDGAPSRMWAASVDSRFFSLLGVAPAAGRLFTAGDDVAGHEPVLVVSHGFWQGNLGGDAEAIGSSIELDGAQYTVVGVAPAGFSDPLAASFALASPPFWRASPDEFATTNRSWRSFWGLARLAPGTTQERLQSQLTAAAVSLETAWPGTNTDVGFSAVGLREHLVGANRPTIVMLASAVLLVLVVACANVANLMLTRGTGRADEHAVRRALGAGRLRVLSPLLVEHGMLATMGLAGGFVVAHGVAWLAAPWTTSLATMVEIRMDTPVLLGAAGFSLIVVMLFGLIPAWQAVAPGHSLARGVRSVGAPGARLRSGLVIVETTLAVTLLVGAGLLVQSFRNMTDVDLGVEVDRAVVATITPSTTRYSTAETLDAVVAQIVAGAARLPGVDAAGVISDLPLSGVANTGWLTRPDRPLAAGEAPPSALYRTVAGDYFRAAGMRLLAGRAFDEDDRGSAPAVAMVNQAVIDRLFPGEPGVGQTIQIMGWQREIVGIVNDVRDDGPAASVPMAVYVPFAQEGQEWATRTTAIVARVASGDPADHTGMLRDAILSVDATTAVNDLRTMESVTSMVTRMARLRTALLGVFAAVAMALAAVGLGGVVAFQVSERRRELGLRMALGATGSRMVGHLVGQGVQLSAVGALAGLAAAAALSRVLSHLLFEVAPLDPFVFITVPAVFLGVAACAALVPASRAARLHPAEALREE